MLLVSLDCPPASSVILYIQQTIIFLLQVFKMADRVKEVAVEEVENIKTQTIRAARSAAYLYPLRARYFPCCSGESSSYGHHH